MWNIPVWIGMVAVAVAVTGPGLWPASSAAQSCGGAYDPTAGTSFGACPPAPAAPPALSLYRRLGGRDGLRGVVDDFVKNLMDDPRVNARFKEAKPADLERIKTNMADLICEATGGPCSYLGRDMKSAHQGMNVTDAEWTATVEDLVKALDKNGASAPSKRELLALLDPMKKDILGQ